MHLNGGKIVLKQRSSPYQTNIAIWEATNWQARKIAQTYILSAKYKFF